MNQYDQLYTKFSKELEKFKTNNNNVFNISSYTANSNYNKYYLLIGVFIVLFLINKSKS
jgi:hypothetical protein